MILHNLRYDQQVTSFVHDAAGGAVTALSLMDAPNHKPLLAVGGTTGVITLWDLGKRKLHAMIKVRRPRLRRCYRRADVPRLRGWL